LALCVLLFVERRLGQIQAEGARNRAQTTDALFAVLGNMPSSGREPLCDKEAAQRALRERFGEATVRAFACNPAMDVVRVNLKLPLLEALLAVIDLEHKDLVIELDGKFDKKSLTSTFAQAAGCSIAINGEAGASPGPNSGLGPWRGHLVRNGSALLAETADNPLPFLSFDRQNRARFTSSQAKERTLHADSYNVIYGRVDSIVAGKAITEPFRHNQPRTVMGLDASGTKLFLLVVDGRQMSRSWGLTRAEVGDFLRAFGVHDAMLCDEGGSSCMVVDMLGGLATVPASDGGQERPTYSHFGVALRRASSRPTK